jgi:hypothetical protein
LIGVQTAAGKYEQWPTDRDSLPIEEEIMRLESVLAAQTAAAETAALKPAALNSPAFPGAG